MTGGSVERRVAKRLAELYEEGFGGKARGRFRISMKHMRELTGRKRIPAEMIRGIGDELFELGFVLIDLETFFAVLAQRTFVNYRRVADANIAKPEAQRAHAASMEDA